MCREPAGWNAKQDPKHNPKSYWEIFPIECKLGEIVGKVTRPLFTVCHHNRRQATLIILKIWRDVKRGFVKLNPTYEV